MELAKYIETTPRGTAAGLARLVGVHPVMVSQWCTGLKPVPFERCVAIERATDGAVSRRDLRPNDWHLHWPELITADHPAPVESPAEAAAQ